MMFCRYVRVAGTDDFQCSQCSRILRNLPDAKIIVRRCTADGNGPPVKIPYRAVERGVGFQVKRILKKLKFVPKPGCQCNARAREMDRQGPQWCRDNIEMIVDWLQEEFNRQKKMHRCKAKCPNDSCGKTSKDKIPLALKLPFSRLAAKVIVETAIAIAERPPAPRKPRSHICPSE